MSEPTFRRQSEEEMMDEVRRNALRGLRRIDRERGRPALEGNWAPSELWPGEDINGINSAYIRWTVV